MSTAPLAAGAWPRTTTTTFLSTLAFFLFLFLDFLELIFCIIFRYLDYFFEGRPSDCYCQNRGELEAIRGDSIELSETLYGRYNVFRHLGFLDFATKFEKSSSAKMSNNRKWSDCGCESCVSYASADHLYVVLNQPSEGGKEECSENVIFLHGFLSSSSFWTETVFPNLSKHVTNNYRLFAVDLLGFGRSPKPKDCYYTLKDHLEMIERSVINRYELKSFHVVAHSMGCIIALALAAKYSNCVKSITLIAPPYCSSSKEKASMTALEKLAGKKLWPPLLFGSSFMSWYEHLGRCVCLVVCRNHKLWERILKLLTRKRDLHFMMVDLTRHTHHSAWHTMHNVICGGAKLMDDFLETLTESGVKICVMQGDRDYVVPLECGNNIKEKAPNAQLCIISNADHSSVIIGREKDFTQHLEHIWASFPHKDICLQH
ncbi:probable lysophospholipase BODYGUARD 4 [Euphorbia lathyris]|uniref:probable lysophospholipase BODYGUARD 4 n=1 Tax=Euphorbia lathyris TaxID=212925 RepID=UPI0033138633